MQLWPASSTDDLQIFALLDVGEQIAEENSAVLKRLPKQLMTMRKKVLHDFVVESRATFAAFCISLSQDLQRHTGPSHPSNWERHHMHNLRRGWCFLSGMTRFRSHMKSLWRLCNAPFIILWSLLLTNSKYNYYMHVRFSWLQLWCPIWR